MRLYDAYDRQMKAGRPILDELGVVSVRDRYSSYPSLGLTPERLAAIFKEADLGDMLRQAELFEEMEEKDAHLGSVLATRKLAVAGLDWEVVSASKEKEDEEIASFVKEALIWVQNWDDALLDMLDAIGKGFSVSELMWEMAEGRVWVKEIKWRHQKRFTFLNAPSTPPLSLRGGGGELPRLITDAEPVYGENLLPNKFVVHSYRARSGFAPRGGVLRPCAYMYLFKNYAVKDWIVFAERFAMPLRIGKFSQGTSEADRKVLKNAVYNLGADAAAVISDGTVIELLEQAGKTSSAEIYEKLVAFCDRSVSKAVLGHTGSSESAPGKLGSEDAAMDVRRDILEADAKALAKSIQMQVIRPLVEFNFGPGRAMPVFKFHYEAGEDLKAMAETYKVLADSGFDGIPKSHIHKKFGIPLPEGGEETVKGGF